MLLFSFSLSHVFLWCPWPHTLELTTFQKKKKKKESLSWNIYLGKIEKSVKLWKDRLLWRFLAWIWVTIQLKLLCSLDELYSYFSLSSKYQKKFTICFIHFILLWNLITTVFSSSEILVHRLFGWVIFFSSLSYIHMHEMIFPDINLLKVHQPRTFKWQMGMINTENSLLENSLIKGFRIVNSRI